MKNNPFKAVFLFFVNWNQPLGRLHYGLVGVGLFFVKYNLDRFIASFYFDRYWTPLQYLSPTYQNGLAHLSPEEKDLFLVLLVLSIPFVYIGIMLTVRRLRSAGLHLLLSLLFFVPFVNVLFFIMLCVVPPAEERATGGWDERQRTFTRFMPERKSGSMMVSTFLPASLAVPVLLISTSVLQHYGWGIFVGIPFVVGCCSVLLYGMNEERYFWECMVVAFVSQFLLAFFLVGLALEGVLCLVILFPLASIFGVLGGVVGYLVQKGIDSSRTPVHRMMILLFLSMPFLFGFEKHQAPEAPRLEVTSSMIIDAPPEEVWPEVVSFSELDAPEDWVFYTGIAYPVNARFSGRGADAVRYCEFTTGSFIEPIDEWKPPHTLSFSVHRQPSPMKELSPYGHIDTPHMDGFFESTRGRFDLKRLPRERTQLIGTTWYKHRVWPVMYFRIWSDWIVHRIHMRVLRHIRTAAESR